jgi:mechanosensitive ion channel-like protein
MEAALAAFLLAIPSVLGAILILIVGWIIAGWIGRLVTKALRMIRLGQIADRIGVTAFLARAQIQADAAAVFGAIAKWYVRLVVVLLAANAVGLTAVSTIVNNVLAFIPNLVVGVVILAAFSWLAGLTRSLVRGALGGTGMPNADLLATLSYATVFAFGIVAAADQIGVATTLVNTLFIGVVAALAIAFGLAFGLGGREEAAKIWHDWREQSTRALAGASAAGVRDDRTTQMSDGEERRRMEELARRS